MGKEGKWEGDFLPRRHGGKKDEVRRVKGEGEVRKVKGEIQKKLGVSGWDAGGHGFDETVDVCLAGMNPGESKQLGQEGAHGDPKRVVGGGICEAIRIHLTHFPYGLEGVGHHEFSGEVDQCRTDGFFGGVLYLNQHPGNPVANDKEIDFPLIGIPDVMEGKLAESGVCPIVDCLQQMGGHEGFAAGPWVWNRTPVRRVDLGLLTQ